MDREKADDEGEDGGTGERIREEEEEEEGGMTCGFPPTNHRFPYLWFNFRKLFYYNYYAHSFLPVVLHGFYKKTYLFLLIFVVSVKFY